MSRAANTLSSIQASQTKAEQTTVIGNTNARQSVRSVKTSITTLVSTFNGDIQNVTSVASEFARVDQEQSTEFDPIGDLRL
ncbi:hypothetical protein RyT2_25520 [Pseudolactococcus yaeyamensis]